MFWLFIQMRNKSRLEEIVFKNKTEQSYKFI